MQVFTATTRDYLQTLIDRQYIKPLDLTDLGDNVILSFDRDHNGFINVYLGKYPIVSFSNTDPWLVADLFTESKVPCDLLNDFDNASLYFSTSDDITEWLLTSQGLLMTKSDNTDKKWVVAFRSELRKNIFSIQSVSSQTKFFIESVWPDFFRDIPSADFSYHKSDR